VDILSFLDVIWRRRWVVIPGLIVVAAATVGVTKLVKPSYKATSTLVLYGNSNPDSSGSGSTSAKAPDLSNPLLGVSGLYDVTNVMVARMADPEAVAEVGTSSGWTVANVDGSSTPLLIVTVKEKTPTLALATVDKVDQVIETQLVEQQTTDGKKPPDLIHSKLLQKDTQASPVQGSRIRAAAATAVLGWIVVISLAFAVEALRKRPRRSKHGTHESEKPRKESRRHRRRKSAGDRQTAPADDVVAPPVSIAGSSRVTELPRANDL